jgi:hypothetical protein
MSEGGQGQSTATIDKERRIGVALAMGMMIAEKKCGQYGFPFWFFDANAGSGFNSEFKVPGSPVVAWEAARRHLNLMPFVPFFCDIDKGRLSECQSRLNRMAAGNSVFIPYDNEEALLLFGQCILSSGDNREKALGAVLIDPNNGYYRNKDNEGPPIKALEWFVRTFPRIDVIVNINAQSHRRLRGAGISVSLIADLLPSLGKEHWLVGRARPRGSLFVLAIGRNVKTNDARGSGLYHATSEFGRQIIAEADGTRQIGFDLDVPDV